jgi:hypothetical protein
MPGLISSSDFGPARPMLVPSPPLSLTTASRLGISRAGPGDGSGNSSRHGRSGTGCSTSLGRSPACCSPSCRSRLRRAASSAAPPASAGFRPHPASPCVP